jgi:hypothetical protein
MRFLERQPWAGTKSNWLGTEKLLGMDVVVQLSLKKNG